MIGTKNLDLPWTRTRNLWFRRPTRYPEDGSGELLPGQVCGGKFTIAPADLFSLNNKIFPILPKLTFHARLQRRRGVCCDVDGDDWRGLCLVLQGLLLK